MARLTDEQWAEIRALWEASPQQGLAWITRKAGGAFDVTPEAIRQRRGKDGWTKVALTSEVVQDAHRAADRLAAERLKAGLGPDNDAADCLVGYAKSRLKDAAAVGDNAPNSPDSGTPDQPKAALSRGEIEEAAERFGTLHRQDWRVARGLFAEAVRERDLVRGRLAKLLVDALATLHAGERRDNGLDKDPIVYSKASEAELQAIASGRRPGARHE